jgi:hypothetical protein
MISPVLGAIPMFDCFGFLGQRAVGVDFGHARCGAGARPVAVESLPHVAPDARILVENQHVPVISLNMKSQRWCFSRR